MNIESVFRGLHSFHQVLLFEGSFDLVDSQTTRPCLQSGFILERHGHMRTRDTLPLGSSYSEPTAYDERRSLDLMFVEG